MFLQQNEGNVNAWKTEMQMYEKNKRTKKPFGKTTSQLEYVTHEKVKSDECRFNPVLQAYSRADDELRANEKVQQKRTKSLVNHLKQTVKHQKNFDIVNLYSNQPYTQKTPGRKLGPIRNAYNVINNQKLPEYFFEKRDQRLPIQRNKTLLSQQKRQFDIVTNNYRQENEKKIQEQIDKEANHVYNKYWKTHNYDPVFGKFYDAKKEHNYQQKRKEDEREHGKDAGQKLPPSYVYRDPLIIDYSKQIPEAVQVLDQRNHNAKKRYQTRYVVLDEYQKRNIEEDEKHSQIVKNHVHFGRVLDQKYKQFNIVTNIPYKQTRAEQLYGKKLQVQSWDKLLKQASKVPQTRPKPAIKTGGFS